MNVGWTGDRWTGDVAPLPIDMLRLARAEPRERVVLVYASQRHAWAECLTLARAAEEEGDAVQSCKPNIGLIRLANGSEVHCAYVGGLKGMTATSLWLHQNVDAEDAHEVRIVPRETKGEQKNPEPAAGQVWRIGDGSSVVLGAPDANGHFRVGSGPSNVALCAKHYGWNCIGVETPHGRVMVGERRRHPHGTVYTVLGVLDGGTDIRIHEGHDPWRQPAERVAQWPIVTDHLSPHGATFAAAKRLAEQTGMPYDEAIREVERLVDGSMRAIRETIVGPDLIEHDHRIGTHPWYIAETARICGVLASEVTVDSNSVGRVAVRVPACAAQMAKYAEQWLRMNGPAAIQIGVFVDWAVDKFTATVSFTAPDPLAPLRSLAEAVAAIVQTPLWQRREIDRGLAEDARLYPAFATARKCAVMAAMERDRPWPVEWPPGLCKLLREYEDMRGGMTKPSHDAAVMACRYIHPDTIAAYERARSLA